MAGYLGKISAVVSANTGDFKSKLGGAAKDVQNFARQVQSNLTSASKDAAKAFKDIYTPLQQFERSLQAASTMKLSFKGFAGAIKDIDALKVRLTGLRDSQIGLVVKASGFQTITAFREAIRDINSKDIDVIAKVGGLDKLRELRNLSKDSRQEFVLKANASDLLTPLREARTKVADLRAAMTMSDARGGVSTVQRDEYRSALQTLRQLQQEARKEVRANVGVNLDDKALDELIAKASKISNTQIKAVINVLGQQDLEAAVTKAQRLQSVAKQISEPFGVAVAKVAAMSTEVQAGFLPSLKRSQAQLESLVENIEKGVLPASAIAQQFAVVEKRASAATASINRLAESSAKVGSMKTGQELAFAAPQLSATLDRGVDIGNKAAALPASAIQANPRVASMLQEISTLSNEAVAAYARLQVKMGAGIPTASSQKQLDGLQAKLDTLFAEFDATYKIHVDAEQAKKALDDLAAKMQQTREQTAFVITGRPQNLEQAESRRAGIDADVGSLDRSQRQNLKPLLEAADAARATGDIDKINAALDALAFRVAEAKRYNVDFEKAKKDSLDLKATMESLKDQSNFVISAKVQNAGQAESEIRRIIGGLEQLDAAQRDALQPKVNAAISSLGAKDAKTGLPDIAAISAAVKDLTDEFNKELVVKVSKDEAQKSVDELKASLASIADKIGEPSEPIDRLRKAVDAAIAAIAKMPAGAIRTKLEGDLNAAKIDISAVAQPGMPVPPPDRIDAGARKVNAIAAAAEAATPGRGAANPLGADFGTAERKVASLQSTVVSLQGSLEKLPMPMQAQFVPAINKVRDAFQKLTPASTAAEIDAVIKKAAGLERAFTRAGQAAKFGGTLGEALNEAAIAKTEKQLGFIKAKLLEVGATASGPVANAFNAYSAAAAAAANAGTSGTIKTTKELDGLIAKIGEALVAEGKLTASQGRAFSKNVGDVGRAGADKFSLALNQAAFAIDDFMSSTGGMEFKLRAISNNITQLGFVLGGTTGLFVSLGTVIASQAAIALIKFANNGRSAEDRVKALNDALSRQKSLVEELATAYRSLGDSLSRGTASPAGESAADFERQLDDVRKKQQESVRKSVSDFDPRVVTERAEQKKLQSRIDKSEDPGEIIGLQRQLEESRKRETAAADAAEAMPPPDMASVQQAMVDTFNRLANAAATDATLAAASAGLGQVEQQMQAEAAARPFQERAAGVELPDDPVAARAAVTSLINDLAGQIDAGYLTGFQKDAARKQITALNQILGSLEAPVRRALNEAANKIFEASRGPAEKIRQAQDEVAKALELGQQGAGKFAAELDKSAAALRQAYKDLESAAEETDPDKKEAKTNAAQKTVDELKKKSFELEQKARLFREERIVDPQRLTDSRLGRAGGNLSDAGLSSGMLARRAREIEFRREMVRNERTLSENQTPEAAAALDQLDAELNRSAAALEAATIAVKLFGEALNRASEEAKGNLNSAQQAADQTRRADLGNSTPRSRQERELAAADLERQQELQREAQDKIENARAKMEENAAFGKSGQDILNRKRELEEGLALQQAARELDAEVEREGVDTGTYEGDIAELEAKGKKDLADRTREMLRRLTEFGGGGAGTWDKIRELEASAPDLQAEADSTFADEFARIREINEELASGSVGAADQATLRAERAKLETAVEPERKRIEAEAQAAVEASTREEEQRQSAARGRELRMTPAQRAAEDVAQGLEDIRQAFGREAESTTGIVDIKGQQQAQRRFLDDQMRAAAPAIAGLADSVANAVIQGPSRAALQATDASGVEGMRELDRLLRGDDSARDQNFVELQKQSELLQGIKTAVEQSGAAGILDM